jgi:hypothetical protein
MLKKQGKLTTLLDVIFTDIPFFALFSGFGGSS